MKKAAFLCIFLFVNFVAYLHASDIPKSTIFKNYGKIQLSFIENKGQTDSGVKFTSTGSGAAMFFTTEGTTFLLSKNRTYKIPKKFNKTLFNEPLSILNDYINVMEIESGLEKEYFSLKLKFVNANPNPRVIGEEILSWNTNYFIGNNSENWRTGIANFSKVRLQNLYPGIDLVYYGNQQNIKYDFVAEPGADPGQILLAYDFGSHNGGSVSINEKGELVVKTTFGDLIERKPYCYQIIDGKKVEIGVVYKILNAESNSFSFAPGTYDTTYPLIIDPELKYSTFLGGNGEEYARRIKIDGSGNVYITGRTASSNFPVTAGAFDQIYNGGAFDVFVSKLNASGSALVYSTFLGGTGDDNGNGIAVDGSGNAYITGPTGSSDFPVTSGAYDQSYNGGSQDVFVCKLNASGSVLVYSTAVNCYGLTIISPTSTQECGVNKCAA